MDNIKTELKEWLSTSRKGTKVINILDSTTEYLRLNGFVVLEDTWINEFNEKLYDQYNNVYLVLDFYVLEKEETHHPLLSRFDLKPIINKFSCLLLDKPIKVGDVLYTNLI